MKPKHAFVSTLVLISFGVAMPAWADDLRSSMEADNAKWLQAFNTRNTKVMPAMYTQDAIILAPNSAPVKGREAIGQFWDKTLKDGKLNDHTFEIVDVKQVGNQAYQVARYTLVAVAEDGKSANATGNAVRIFERQPDGTWLTKVQIFN
jgi:uncharacterized protein (TIGR02246 family)